MNKIEDRRELVLVLKTFKALSDYTRYSIVLDLLDGERSLGCISKYFEISSKKARAQIKLLEEVRLVKTRTDGPEVVCSIAGHSAACVVTTVIGHALQSTGEAVPERG